MDIVRCVNGELRFQCAVTHRGQWLFTELHRLFMLMQCETQMRRERLSPHLVYVCPDTEEDAMRI